MRLGLRTHPHQISEAEFWTRYFTSRLWEQHRASVRKTTNEEVNKKQDDIFDRYLEEPDWGEWTSLGSRTTYRWGQVSDPVSDQAPRRGVEVPVGRFLDLAATEEDHGDVSRSRCIICGYCAELSVSVRYGSRSHDASWAREEFLAADTAVQ